MSEVYICPWCKNQAWIIHSCYRIECSNCHSDIAFGKFVPPEEFNRKNKEAVDSGKAPFTYIAIKGKPIMTVEELINKKEI